MILVLTEHIVVLSLSLPSPLIRLFPLENLKLTLSSRYGVTATVVPLARCKKPSVLAVLIISHLRASLAERRKDVWGLTHRVNLAFLPCARRDLCALREHEYHLYHPHASSFSATNHRYGCILTVTTAGARAQRAIGETEREKIMELAAWG